MKTVGRVGFLLVAVGFLVVAAVWYAFVLTIMWRWFFVPIFELPLLTIPQAIGIGMVVYMLTGSTESSDTDDWKSAMALIFLRPLFILGIGWIALQFMT